MNKIKRIRRKQWIKAFKLMGAMNNTDLLNLFISRLSLKALIFLLQKEAAQTRIKLSYWAGSQESQKRE